MLCIYPISVCKTYRFQPAGVQVYIASCSSSCILCYFEFLIVTILHVFCCLKMLATRWSLFVSILKIVVHALSCQESIVWIICCICFFNFVGAHLHLFCKVQQQLYIVIFWIAYQDHISCILLFGNAHREMKSVCLHFEIYCSCSWLPREHSMNNLSHFFIFCWCAPSFILAGTTAAVYCDIMNCLLWPYFTYFAVWKCLLRDGVCVFQIWELLFMLSVAKRA